VRIPIPWVILLAIIAVAVPLWLGMKDVDFLTPPDQAALDTIRAQTESALPRMANRTDAISPQTPQGRRNAEAPTLQLGDLAKPPNLDEYADLTKKGAANLIEIATRLEDKGHPERALLAWERVIDSADSDSAELESAFEAVARLRVSLPPWKRDTEAALAVVLQAGTGQKSAETLAPILKQAAADLERASSGILKVTTVINTGAGIEVADAPVPVAIWLSGPPDKDHSTEVLSFTIATPDSLEYDLQRTLYQLIQNHFRLSSKVRPPTPLPDEGDPKIAITRRMTRLHWQLLGEFLTAGEKNPQTNP
jgi:hypothetical protein